MNVPREIIVRHQKVDEAVTQEQLAAIESLLVDTLFSLWLREKGFTVVRASRLEESSAKTGDNQG